MDALEEQRKYAKGLAVRTRIVDAAGRAFARAGYGSTSVMDLAAAAGVTKNQLFHHFGGKEAIALAALEAADNLWRNEVAVPAQIYPEPGAQLEAMLKRTGELCARGEPFLRLLAAFSAQHASLPPALQEKTGAVVAAIIDFLRGRLKQLKRHSATGPAYKARELATCLAAALLGGEVLAAAGWEGGGKEALELVLDLIRGGTALAPEAGPEPGAE